MSASSLYSTQDVRGWTALVTGATAGIGEATAWRLAELGCHVILTGRREERLKSVEHAIKDKFPSAKILGLKLDVTNQTAVAELPDRLKEAGEDFANVDILVNNAGLAIGADPVDKNKLEDVIKVINTNVVALIQISTIFIPLMKSRGRGHVINVGSVAGHEPYPGGTIYNASKHAVTGYTYAARMDLIGTPIRVTCISPGMVKTEFSDVRFGGDKEKSDGVYDNIVPLNAADIADQIVYSVTRPAHHQIADIISYATNQGGAKFPIARPGADLGGPQ